MRSDLKLNFTTGRNAAGAFFSVISQTGYQIHILANYKNSHKKSRRVLEQKGLIDIKTGVSGGAIVKEIGTPQITESLDLLMQYQKVSVEHLSEFRHEIERTVTALAAERATKRDIQ